MEGVLVKLLSVQYPSVKKFASSPAIIDIRGGKAPIVIINMPSRAGLSEQEMQYVISHVFLPPKVPQNGDDDHAMANEMSLLHIVCTAFDLFRTHVQSTSVKTVYKAQGAISQLYYQRDENDDIEVKKLQSMFRNLRDNGMHWTS